MPATLSRRDPFPAKCFLALSHLGIGMCSRDRLIENWDLKRSFWRTLVFHLKPAFVVYSTRVDTSKLNTYSHVTTCGAMLIQVTSSSACDSASEPISCYRFEKFSLTVSRIAENGVLVKMEGRAKSSFRVPWMCACVFHIAEDLLSKRWSMWSKLMESSFQVKTKRLTLIWQLGTQYVCDVKVQCWIVPLD